MTQDEKKLLLRDLCARLPYGVKGMVSRRDHNNRECEFVKTIDGKLYDRFAVLQESWYDNVTIKPYLFPLSSMTEEQKKDIFHNGKFYIDRHNSLCRFPMYEDDYDFVTMEDCLEIFNKLNKYHFDYRGLIPMGLANDATGLNIY